MKQEDSEMQEKRRGKTKVIELRRCRNKRTDLGKETYENTNIYAGKRRKRENVKHEEKTKKYFKQNLKCNTP